MLQQTQVDRVIPYFNRWMQHFPNVATLASASLTDVLRCWSGLGYNRRAKFLHMAAKRIASEGMPVEYDDLRALPGIGDYTAKAVRVFAYDEPETLIETNIRSVFIHHFFPRSRRVNDTRLMPFIAATLSPKRPRQWYSALMDYGAFLKATKSNPSRKSRHHTKQSQFIGSLRQVRGAIVKAAVEGKRLDTVRALYPDRFEKALEALVREGLIGESVG
jgi:A/G-specific adenine glycosylase